MPAANGGLHAVYRHLRRAVLLRDGGGLSDGQLLELFANQRDEAALEALIHRHSPMVMRVCRRVLGHHHDAEDAFQAAFLVFARKAARIHPRDRIAGWLHGVAYRTALKARSSRAKAQSRQVFAAPEPVCGGENEHRELAALIDRELDCLGAKYRLPVLLCDLEGKTIKAVARELGWPEGTVAGRLARARKLLGKRLARHGFAAVGGLTVLQGSASASVPLGLVQATVQAAGACLAQKELTAGLISANVATLVKGATMNMMFAKAKPMLAVLVLTATVGVGGTVVSRATMGAARGADEDGPVVAAAQAEEAFDPKMKAQLEETYKRLTRQINEAFPESRVELKLGGNKVMVTGRTKDLGDAVQILRIAKANAPPGDEDPRAGVPTKKDESAVDILISAAGPNVINLLNINRDEDRMQGDWVIIYSEKDGEDITPQPFEKDGRKVSLFGFTFVGNQMNPFTGPKREGDEFEVINEPVFAFKLNAALSPKRIIMTTKSPAVDHEFIYRFEGDNLLRTCASGQRWDDPPTEFTAPKGSGRQMTLYRRLTNDNPPEKPTAAVVSGMFPDGQEHDFGIVEKGKTVKHSFRIVNTTKHPMELAEVRVSCGCLAGKLSAKQLRPGEEASVTLTMDTRTVIGVKKVVAYVTTTSQGTTESHRFTVRADSRNAANLAQKIGTIILVGDQMDGIAGTLMRKELELYPGQPVDHDVIAKKLKNFRELAPDFSVRIKVLDNPGEFNDILVNVEKQPVPNNPANSPGALVPMVNGDKAPPQAARPHTPTAADILRLQGIWSVTSIERGGKAAKLDKKAYFLVDGKRACFQIDGENIEGGFYLEPTAEPKAFDFVTSAWTRPGIYAINGDTLRMCYDLGTATREFERPRHLATREGDRRQVLLVLKRIMGAEASPFYLRDGTRGFPDMLEKTPVGPPPPHPVPRMSQFDPVSMP